MNFLSGNRTYIAAVAAIVVGAIDLTVYDVPSVEGGNLIMEGIMFFLARLGIAKAEAAAKSA